MFIPIVHIIEYILCVTVQMLGPMSSLCRVVLGVLSEPKALLRQLQSNTNTLL